MRRVFSRPLYVVVAAIISIIVFFSVVWVPAIPLAAKILSDTTLTGNSVGIVTDMFISSLGDIQFTTIILIAILSALVGLNTTLLSFYIRMFRAAPTKTEFTTGLIGGVSAMLGFGCAACGSVFIASLLSSFAGTGFLALFPFEGQEFLYGGMLMLVVSSFLLARSINKPPVCPI